jgi:peptidylprolyl isomerase
MTLKFSSVALLAALTTAATAQTSTPKHATSTPHAAAAKSATTSKIPRVAGIPRTLYALKYIDIHIGTGPVAEPSVLGTSQATSKIEWYSVRYTGWLTDGTKFDSSFDHPGGEPLTLPIGVHRVILGWDTGFQGMRVGGKRRLFIPYQLAYGEAGKPPVIPAKSNLIFDVELVSVSDKPPAPRQPAPAAKPAPVTPPPAQSKPADTPATPPPTAAPAAQPATVPPPADPTKPETTPHPKGL